MAKLERVDVTPPVKSVFENVLTLTDEELALVAYLVNNAARVTERGACVNGGTADKLYQSAGLHEYNRQFRPFQF